MAFFLFLLVNVALFVRPAEIVPALEGFEIYFYCIAACLVVSFPDILRYLSEKSLTTEPITLMLFALVPAVFVAGTMAIDITEGWSTVVVFAKIVLYYLLFVSVVTTSNRLRIVLIVILLSLAALTLLAVLNYHEIIQLKTLAMGDQADGKYGDVVTIQRLQGSGFYGDPNEMCVMLAAMVPLCLYFVMLDRNLLFRCLAAAMLPLFGYAIYLTQSRGGFLAFVGSLAAFFWSRYGWQKTALIGIVGLPVLLLVFGARQTTISTSTNTAQNRIYLWKGWFYTFREHMVTGNGMSHQKEDPLSDGKDRTDMSKMVAHNSYLQGFADLGFAGGCLFMGAFITAVWSLIRFNARYCKQTNEDLKQLQPFLLATLVAYCLGMMTLSIPFIVPTYLVLALAVVYTRMAQRTALFAPPPLRIDNPALIGSILAAGVCFLIGMYIFINTFA